MEVTIDVPVDAYLPVEYVARDDVRMEAYRRLAAVASPEDVEDIRAEWNDRYGPPPAPAAALLDVARLRAECVRTGVRSVSVQRAHGGATLGGHRRQRLPGIRGRIGSPRVVDRLPGGAERQSSLRRRHEPPIM